jgi:hypothetical protein
MKDAKRALNFVYNMVSRGRPDEDHPDFEEKAKAVRAAGNALHPSNVPWRWYDPGQANALLSAVTKWIDAHKSTLERETLEMRENLRTLVGFLKKKGVATGVQEHGNA